MNVSVAMAAYNGEKYISEQIESIITQLDQNDELIISINPSSDSTENIVENYCKQDKRVKMSICQNKGVLANFENAIRLCKNDIIFLADQDDVWMNNKIKRICQMMKKTNFDGLAHMPLIVDSNLNLLHEKKKVTFKIKRVLPFNILYRNTIQGSCLAFKKEYLKYILPFPKNIPMHDSWIGMIIATYGKIGLVNEAYIYYRQHDNNVTSRNHKKLKNMIKDRCNLMLSYLSRIISLKRKG